ncbi:MAG: hypothetical protein Q9191_007421, partial [Dirinaria sp. TL-2023a]
MARPRKKTQSSTKSGAPQSRVIDVSGASSPLYRLSNELILSILDLLYLNDLVGFASSCRFVYSLAGPALDRHKALWRQYYALANPHDKMENQVFPRVLTEFIRHPEHAAYLRHLYVRRVIPVPVNYWVPPGLPRPPLDDGEDKKYHDASLDLLEQAVHDLNISDQDWKESGNVYSVITPQDWLRIMSEGLAEADEHVIEALLILLVPNLETLTLSVAMFRHPSIYMALNRALSPRPPAALRKLETMELTGASFCRYSHVLAGLERLARLPSFKCIRCIGVRIYGGDESDWYLTPSEVFSGITALEYYECYFVQGPMLQLLQAAKSLKHFVFTTYTTSGGTWMTDPYHVLSCISESARKTLVSLNLSGFQFNEGGPCKRTRSKGNLETLKSQGGCLRDFGCLEEITVDFGLLFAGSKFSLCTLEGEMPSSARTLELHFEEDNIISQDLAIKKIYDDLKNIKKGGFKSALGQVRMTNVTAAAMEQVFRHLNPKDVEDV